MRKSLSTITQSFMKWKERPGKIFENHNHKISYSSLKNIFIKQMQLFIKKNGKLFQNGSKAFLWNFCLDKFPFLKIEIASPTSNQITVVAFQSVQLAQTSFLQKNQMLQNVFLISAMLRWHSGIKNQEIWTFKVNFLCRKTSKSF